jgi:hypothetical protein
MIKCLFLLTIVVLTASTLNHVSSQQNNLTSKPPAFKDGGKTIERLKTVYKCRSIEFENWEEDDASDFTLTVCLINSKKVPTGHGNEKELETIARQIKNAVRYPEKYRSYYIIFVKRETHFGITSSSHTAGADIPGKVL